MSALNVSASIALLIVMVAAVGSKVASKAAFDEFALSLAQFGVRRRQLRRPAAVAVIGLELATIGFLLLPIDSRLVRLGPSTVLLTGFSIAVLIASGRTPKLACHCFGSSSATPVGLHLGINGLLIVLGASAIVAPGSPVTSAGGRVLAIGIGLILGSCVLTLPPVLQTLAPELLGTDLKS